LFFDCPIVAFGLEIVLILISFSAYECEIGALGKDFYRFGESSLDAFGIVN